jgi:hypothetical protein
VPVDGRDTAAREAIAFTTPAGADVDRATTGLLATATAGAGPDRELRATDLAPRVADGEDAEDAEAPEAAEAAEATEDAEPTLDPADSVDPVSSADATAVEANSPPTPNATARAPTRPTYRAWLDAPRRTVDSMLADRCAFTDHHLL